MLILPFLNHGENYLIYHIKSQSCKFDDFRKYLDNEEYQVTFTEEDMEVLSKKHNIPLGIFESILIEDYDEGDKKESDKDDSQPGNKENNEHNENNDKQDNQDNNKDNETNNKPELPNSTDNNDDSELETGKLIAN